MGGVKSKEESKKDSEKRDKNHNRQKMFKLGISFGRNDLCLEGHLQMGYNSKTIKNYGEIPNPSTPPTTTILQENIETQEENPTVEGI